MSGEFSEELRVALAAARGRAKSHGLDRCDLPTLLSTLLENLDEVSYQGLERLGLDPESLRTGEPGNHEGDDKWLLGPPLDPKVRRSLDYAIEEAKGRKVYPSHMLLGALKAIENFGKASAMEMTPPVTYAKLKRTMGHIGDELEQAVEHFSWEVVNSLYFARKIAVESRNLRIGLSHLLAGAFMEPSNEALAVFSSLGLDSGELLEKSLEVVASGGKEWRSITKPVMSCETLEALYLADAEAQRMEFMRYGICHIFLGVFRVNEKYGAIPFLGEMGLELPKIRWAVLKMAKWTNKQDSQLEKFGADSIQALTKAAREARELGSQYVHIDHILVGLLDDPTNKACVALNKSGVDTSAIVAVIQSSYKKKKGSVDKMEIVSLSHVASRALELAKEEALSRGEKYVGSDSILLGLLGVEEGAGMLENVGLDCAELKNSLISDRQA